MLRLNRFSYLAPTSVEEAISLLQQHGQNAMLLAGGTDLLVNIKHRLFTPDYVISIRRLPELQGISLEPETPVDNVEAALRGTFVSRPAPPDPGRPNLPDHTRWLTIGAGTTLKQLESNPLIRTRYPALAEAAHLISTPQVRAVGTIGGNICLDTRCNYYNQSYEWRKGIGFCMKKDSPICRVAPGGDRCWAVASADTVPVLIALRGEISVAGPSGHRRVPIESLYQDDGLIPLTLQFGEIVTALHLPPPFGWECVYQKFRIRHSFDFPLVGVATAVRRNPDGMVEEARVVLTAVASYPERAIKAEQALIGQKLAPSAIEAAGQMVFRLAKPMDNTAGTIFHRKRMARVLFERGLREIAGMDQPARATA